MADEQKFDPVESARGKYPALKDWSDDKILRKLVQPNEFRKVFPEYGKLDDTTIRRNMAAVAKSKIRTQPEESRLSRFAGQLHAFGPTGIIQQTGEAIGEAAKPSLKNIGLQAIAPGLGPMIPSTIETVKGMGGMVPEAAKFYSGLTPGGMGQKGTITQPGMGTAIKEAAPEIGGAVAGLTLDELVGRAGPPLVKKGIPAAATGAGKVVSGAGKVMQEHPFVVGGPVGAATLGKAIGGHGYYVGYLVGASLSRSVGRALSRFGARLAEFGGQVDHLGPVPGTKAFSDFSKEVVKPEPPRGGTPPALPPGETAPAAPKMGGKAALLGDVAPVGEEATGSIAAQKRAMALLDRHGSVVDKDVAARLIAGGSPVNEFMKLRPEYEPRAQALVVEMNPSDIRTQAAKEYTSHAIPAINDYMDRYVPGSSIKSPADALQHAENALPAIWNEQEGLVKPIANKKVSTKGISGEIGSKFNESELAGNAAFKSRVVSKLKEYAGRTNITVGKIFKDVTDLNTKLRDRTLPYETRQVMQAEADVLRDRLYKAFKENLPQDVYDRAIMQRQKYGAVKEFAKDMRKAHGNWVKKGMDNAPSRIDPKGVKMNQVFEDVFKHEKGKGPTAFTPPVRPEAPAPATTARASGKTASAATELTNKYKSMSLEELRQTQQNIHTMANAGAFTANPDKFIEVMEPLQAEIDRRAGIKPTTVTEKGATIQPESAARTRARRTAMKTEAATQQEQQLGGGRRTKPTSRGDL